MDVKQWMIDSIKNASLEEILDRRDIDTLEWFWINRDIFKDILRNISNFDYDSYESQADQILASLEDQAFIQLLRGGIEKRNFIEIPQSLYAKLEQDYRVVEDIQTWVFLKESYYNRLWIKMFHNMEWVLKAMAINAYQRLDTPYSSLEETYQELFENNTQIIEEMVNSGQYSLEVGRWVYDRKEGSLTFYKNGKPFQSWGKGEAEFKFDELQLP